MKFNTLKERMEYYRDIVDYSLTPNSYVMVMVDGRAFSHYIKKKFKLPYDDTFINMMNETAAYVCKNVQGCKMAYTQSDEISFVITDFDTPETDAFFGFRLCKLQSIIASLATSKFNQMAISNLLLSPGIGIIGSNEDAARIVDDYNPIQFDCKAWVVPSYNDVFAWFKYRQNDCIKNSKQQAAQTYLPHKSLVGKKNDMQIDLLKKEKGIDWNTDYDDGKKYGRLIYKEQITYETQVSGKKGNIIIGGSVGDDNLTVTTTRNVWKAHYAKVLDREYFDSLGLVPDRDRIKETDPETVIDKINNLNDKSFLNCEGKVVGLPDGSFKMPFFYGLMDDSRPVKFVFRGDVGKKADIGHRFKIVSSRDTDNGPLYFADLLSEKTFESL